MDDASASYSHVKAAMCPARGPPASEDVPINCDVARETMVLCVNQPNRTSEWAVMVRLMSETINWFEVT